MIKEQDNDYSINDYINSKENLLGILDILLKNKPSKKVLKNIEFEIKKQFSGEIMQLALKKILLNIEVLKKIKIRLHKKKGREKQLNYIFEIVGSHLNILINFSFSDKDLEMFLLSINKQDFIKKDLHKNFNTYLNNKLSDAEKMRASVTNYRKSDDFIRRMIEITTDFIYEYSPETADLKTFKPDIFKALKQQLITVQKEKQIKDSDYLRLWTHFYCELNFADTFNEDEKKAFLGGSGLIKIDFKEFDKKIAKVVDDFTKKQFKIRNPLLL